MSNGPQFDSGKHLHRNKLWRRKKSGNSCRNTDIRSTASPDPTWIPARTVGVSNYIQLDAIINPWLGQKRLLPCNRWPRAALEV